MDEAEGEAEDEFPEFVPHPASSESIRAEKRNNAAFRILDLLDVRD